MSVVRVCKQRLQMMRDDGWNLLLDEVSSFCEIHEPEVPDMNDAFVAKKTITLKAIKKKNLHYYCVELFCAIIDLQLQELNNRFNEVHSCFTFAADPDFLENDIRVKPDLDALGALGDAGWYCVRAILWAADFELPKSVIASRGPIFNKAGVILSCGASLHYEDGKVATFHCSFFSNLTMDVTAIGTKGTLHLNDFVIPFEESKASFTAVSDAWFNDLVSAWVPRPSEHTVMTNDPQEALMVKEFSRLVSSIKNNGLEPETKWPTLSRKTQLVLDAVKASIESGFEPVEVLG